jgi:hypothetical protein
MDAAREKATGRRAHGTDGALDGVEIDIDAAIVDDAAQVSGMTIA